MGQFPIDRFNWVDVLAVTLLIRMGYIGFRLGLSAELVKLTGFVVGFFVSFRYYQQVGDWMATHTFLGTEWASVFAMALLIGVTTFLVTSGLRLLEKLVQVTFQERLNRIGGFLAGAFRGLLVTSVILVAFSQLPSPYLASSIEERSMSGRFISRVAPAVYDASSPWVSHLVASLHDS